MFSSRFSAGATLAVLLLLGSNAAFADRPARYEVTVTNLTKGQTFTPILVTTHSNRISLFEAGSPASDELEVLAEDGNTAPLTEFLESHGRRVADVETIPGLLGPGQSAKIKVKPSRRARRLSVAAMLIPTNDNFFALDAVSLPSHGSRTYWAPAYDAGTEQNDQDCAHIPGPRCGGEGLSPEPGEGDEGFVFIGNGFHDLGDAEEGEGEILGPFKYDWRNPVARIDVRRVD